MRIKSKLKQQHPIALSYIASAIEHRGSFTVRGINKMLEVRLRSKGGLPRLLHRTFGGSCSVHTQNDVKPRPPKREVYQVRGAKAVVLLQLLIPYFTFRKKEAELYLRICAKKRAA